MSLGSRIRMYREKKKLLAKELAFKLGVKESAISKYETGASYPKVENIIKICNILEASPNDLFQDEVSFLESNSLSSEELKLLSSYKKLSGKERQIADILLDLEQDDLKGQDYPINYSEQSNIIYLPVCEQRASAGMGKEGWNEDRDLTPFDADIVPKNATHGIIIEGNSMEPKFHDKQIVFVDGKNQCAPDEYGIFSYTTDNLTKIYFKQLKVDDQGKQYLHSINKDVGDPEIEMSDNVIIKCLGKVLDPIKR